MKFTQKQASKISLAKRSLVFGVGLNDATYSVRIFIDGKWITCPFYRKWHNMLKRCYCKKEIAKNPTYKGCSVNEKWLTFSVFRSWMNSQDWEGKHLDKDILIQGNKIYSSDACVFVDPHVNYLLSERCAARGKYKLGVSFDKRRNNYQASCSVNARKVHIGTYNSEGDAHEAYKKFKLQYIATVASTQTEPIRSALLAHKVG